MTNPFLKYREQVARAICEEQSVQMDEPCYACDSGDCETLGLAIAALDALWQAMQAEGSVREAQGRERDSIASMEPRIEFVKVWDAGTDGVAHHPGYTNFPCLIIRTEPTEDQPK